MNRFISFLGVLLGLALFLMAVPLLVSVFQMGTRDTDGVLIGAIGVLFGLSGVVIMLLSALRLTANGQSILIK